MAKLQEYATEALEEREAPARRRLTELVNGEIVDGTARSSTGTASCAGWDRRLEVSFALVIANPGTGTVARLPG